MKKFICFVLILSSIISTLVGCSSTDTTETANKDTNANESNTQTGQEVETPSNMLKFGTWQDVGNDPNNLWYSQYAPAFDDDYIYYIEGAIYRVPYIGGKKERVADMGDSFLNVYDNKLYYVEHSTQKGYHTVVVRKCDLATREESILLTQTNDYNLADCEVKGMLAANGYLVFALYTEKHDEYFMDYYAVDLSTDAIHLLKSDKHAAYGMNVRITVDEKGDFYLLADSDSVNHFQVDVLLLTHQSLASKSPKLETIVGNQKMKSFYSHVLAPDGLMSAPSGEREVTEYQNYKWNDINMERSFGERYLVGSDCGIEAVDMKGEYGRLHGGYTNNNQRFIIGNSMIIVESVFDYDNPTANIYICHDFDVNNPEKIITVTGDFSAATTVKENRFGVWNNKFFIIEEDDNRNLNLITVLPSGIYTKMPITK